MEYADKCTSQDKLLYSLRKGDKVALVLTKLEVKILIASIKQRPQTPRTTNLLNQLICLRDTNFTED